MDLERRCPIHHFRKSGSSGDLVGELTGSHMPNADTLAQRC